MSDAGDTQAAAPPGQRLAEARQAQNLTPADVARQLKLSVWQVEALEADRYQQLPGPIFVRGFIRNYARLVKLDPDELLRELAGSLPPAASRPEAPPSHDIPFPAARRPRWPLFAAAATVVVAVLAGYEFWWNEPDSEATPVVAAARPTPEPAVATVSTAVAAAPAQPASESRPAEGEAVSAPAQAALEASPAPAADAGAEEEKTLKRGERRMKLAFDQESWVEIRDRNERVIFSQLNRPGTQQLVQGVPPFSLVVGNAHGVRLTYEDREVDLAPHTKIDVARLILE